MILQQMSRLFSLGKKQHSEEIYSKGIEIWPQPQQDLKNYSVFGVVPKTCSFDECGTRFMMMRRNGGMNCQDCGNQAKKDCTHLRCRTCCKSRGFQCQTHVKSTWVPASKRRERQQHLSLLQHQQPFRRRDRGDNFKQNIHNQDGAGSSLPCPQPPNPTTGFELGQFPAEVSSASVTFRCVRVSSVDGPDEQCAYQTAVNIGGHVFKGVLYDQGPSPPSSFYTSSTIAAPIEGSSGGGHHQPQQPQQLDFLTTAHVSATATATTGISFDPSLYSAPLHAFMAGTQFFHPQHPN